MNDNTPQVTQEPRIDQVQTNPEITNPAIDNEDPDWRRVREQRKADRKALEEAQKAAAEEAKRTAALTAALEAITNKQQPQQQSYFNETSETEEERIDKRVEEAIKKKEAEYQRQRAEQEKAQYPQRLRKEFPDFDKVCTAENMDYLEYHHPEIAESFSHMPDGFNKWSAMYKLSKKLLPNTDTKREVAKVERNLSKPGSISSPGTTQGESGMPTNARLTEARKKENHDRMQRILKGLS